MSCSSDSVYDSKKSSLDNVDVSLNSQKSSVGGVVNVSIINESSYVSCQKHVPSHKSYWFGKFINQTIPTFTLAQISKVVEKNKQTKQEKLDFQKDQTDSPNITKATCSERKSIKIDHSKVYKGKTKEEYVNYSDIDSFVSVWWRNFCGVYFNIQSKNQKI